MWAGARALKERSGWGGGEGFSINVRKRPSRGRTLLVRSHWITASIISDAENTDKKLDFFPFQLACYFKFKIR